MSNSVTFSRGNTFAATFDWAPGTSGPANLLTTTLTSTLEDNCANSYDLDVAIAWDGLSFEVSAPLSTADWGLGLARWDIKFVFSGGAASHSEVFRVNVIDTVTE